MGLRGRLMTLGLLVISALFARSDSAVGQRMALDFKDTPLEDALYLLGEKAGVDVVFAHRYTQGQTTDCAYEGTSLADAFLCLLRNTDLHAESVQARQYVVIPARQLVGATLTKPDTPPLVGTLSGRVIDGETGGPLPGANVVVTALGIGTTTREDGTFAIDGILPGRLAIHSSFIGFEPNRLVVSTDKPVEIVMSPTAFQAGELVIEGDRSTLENVSTVAGSVRVLDREATSRPPVLRSDDIFGMLRWLPAVRQSGEVGGRLAVRGAGPDQTLHILDGAPLFHPWQAMGLYSTMQTATLKDAQLYSGSIPAEYGGRLSAVLASTMKDGNAVEPHVEATVGSMSSQFMAEAPVSDKLSVMIAGRRSYADGLLSSSGLGTPERTTLQNSIYSDLNAKLTARPWDGHEFRLSMFSGSEHLPLGNEQTPLESIGWGRYVVGEAVDTSTESFQWNSRLASLQHAWLKSQNLLITSTAYYSAYKAQDGSPGGLFTALGHASSVSNLGLRVDGDYFSNNVHTLRAGIQVSRHRFDNGSPSDVKTDAVLGQSPAQSAMTESAVYIEDTWHANQRFHLQPGLRISHFGDRETVDVLPRLNMKLTLDPDRMVIRAGLSRQVQYVHQVADQTPFSGTNPGTRWLPSGIGRLQPSRGIQASLGFESRPVLGLEIKADGYWRSYSGVLIPTGFDALTTGGTLNSGIFSWIAGDVLPGRQRGVGMELSATYRSADWSFWSSYVGEYLREEVTSSLGIRKFAPSRLSIPHTLRMGSSWTGGRWAAALIGEVRNGYPVVVSSGTDSRMYGILPTSDAAYTTDSFDRLPLYARLDATVGYTFDLVGAKWLAQVDVFNLTNRRNVIGHMYDADAGTASQADLKGLPRLPLLKLRVEF